MRESTIKIHDLKYLRLDVKSQWKSTFIQMLTKVAFATWSLPSFNRGGGGGALQLLLYGGVWPQERKIDSSAD